ncbi:hypothetical protein [Thermosynechococcus sp.]|uniref:hypothetical protein n=1 Tax=Thermosynechococcus sp. TaxID=2814275 RepID=UPI00391DC64E
MVGRRRVRAHPDWFFSGFQEGITLWHLSEDESSWQPQLLNLHCGTVCALFIRKVKDSFPVAILAAGGTHGELWVWQTS